MCELPTWRTFIKDKRQSWSAPWWPLWKTSGCSSSRMASTLLKNVMWFCCRNSCMFKWMRPCKRPAIIGRCLGRGKTVSRLKQLLLEQKIKCLQTKSKNTTLFFFFFFTWAKGQGATQPASYMQGWHQIHDFQQTWSLLHQQAVWPGDAPGRQAEKKNIKISSYCAVKYHGEFIVLSGQKRNTILLNPNKSWGELYELTYFVISNGTPQCIC